MATDWSQVWGGHLHILHTCAAAALPVVMAIPHNTRKRSAPFLKRGYKTILPVCMHIVQSLVPRLFLRKRSLQVFLHGHCSTVVNAGYSVQIYHMVVKVPCFHHFGGAWDYIFIFLAGFWVDLDIVRHWYVQAIVSRSTYITCETYFMVTSFWENLRKRQ